MTAITQGTYAARVTENDGERDVTATDEILVVRAGNIDEARTAFTEWCATHRNTLSFYEVQYFPGDGIAAIDTAMPEENDDY